MDNKKFNIGISCIGSGVGQSVINSCRLSDLPLYTVGLGTNPFAYGEYDCDTYDYVPSIYSDNYIEELIHKCKQHEIDLLIPGLDDEAMLFAENADKLKRAGVNAIFSDKELISICRDKEKMSLELNKTADIFVKSYKKETLDKDIKSGIVEFPFITKPRGGFASRGIEIIKSISDLSKINENHIIQELAIPTESDPNYNYFISEINKNKNPQVSEISIEIVVGKDGRLIGKMASFNKLNNGVPIEIVPYENELMWDEIEKLLPVFLKMGLKGPLNIQGRMTKKGLKLFEMNPRFTGITGLRALMGFNEVEACIKEWLEIENEENTLKLNYNRFGMRQTADKVVPVERDQKVYNLTKSLNNGLLKDKKTILITGSGGYLGQNLISELKIDKNFEIWAFDLDKEKTKQVLNTKELKYFDLFDLNSGKLSLGNVDLLLHLGFSRPHCSEHEIAESLKFTNDLFIRAAMHQIPAILNISSQSVYGQKQKPKWNEETPVAPQTPYAQAKYATELVLKSLKDINNHIVGSSIRLGTLGGGKKGLEPVDIVSKFVRKSLDGENIHIKGGNQQFERLDIRDAISGIIRMLKIDPKRWKPIYNLSSGEVINIKNLAFRTSEIAFEIKNNNKINVEIEKENIELEEGMDSTLFYNDMNWKPNYFMDDIIKSLVNYFDH